jgi:polysaccharide export outer membrane protein
MPVVGFRILPLVPMLLLSGCAAQSPAPLPLPAPGAANSDPRLAALWQERVGEARQLDFPIGAGDVLEITVPDLPELEERTVRVGGDGNIELPLVGVIAVAGHTEQQVAELLRRHLEASVMYDPSVSVFVREYRSRVVGVIGAVANPGFHALSSGDDTILDALTLGGGLDETAALHLLFLPAAKVSGEGNRLAAAVSATAALSAPQRADPIVIELSSLSDGGTPAYLALPVQPGDVILVPERGEVLVKGWVHEPGSHPISPRLTVLGAISAAGGLRFAARRDGIELIRSDAGGKKLAEVFDLELLERGEQRDVPVQAGDVIDVSASVPMVVLSALYEFTRSIFNVGFGRTF